MLTWVALLAIVAFSSTTFVLARRKVLAQAGGTAKGMHSLPNYYGGYAALWVGAPAALLLLLMTSFGGRLEAVLLRVDPPAAGQALDRQQQNVFYDDARAIAHGAQASETVYEGDLKAALDGAVAKTRGLETAITVGTLAAAAALAIAGFLLAFPKLSPRLRARNHVEGWVGMVLVACSVAAILTTVGIIASLVWESLRFFQSVSPIDFLFGVDWNPQIAMRADQV